MNFFIACWHWFTTDSNWSGPTGIIKCAIAQIELSAAAVAAAAVIGVGIGYSLGHTGKGGFFAVNAANAARAVPSLALLTLLVVWPLISLRGSGFYASFLTLVALAVPPILTNSYIAMREVDQDLKESAKSVGMSSMQRLFRVEVPLAAPLTMAGLRTAAIEVVATSTLASIVTFNDLGGFIFAGLNTNDNVESFCGALLVAALAGLTDLFLLNLYRLVVPAPIRNTSRQHKRTARPAKLAANVA